MMIKRLVDLLMTLVLFLLMGFMVTGQELHEWFGTGMLLLAILHNILNYRWYSSASEKGKMLAAFFSWGGNTRGIAQEIQNQTGADLFEMGLVTPYSTDYNTVLEQAQKDQNTQARPELANHVKELHTQVKG